MHQRDLLTVLLAVTALAATPGTGFPAHVTPAVKSVAFSDSNVLTAIRGANDIVKNAPQPRASEIPPYRIGAGDVLAVDVWREPEASSASVPVRPDGKISLPIIGEFQAAGTTPRDLEAALTAKYGEYLRAAKVVITVKEVNSQKVYVIGEVKKEGPIRVSGPVTVLQALAEAGGMTDYAKRKKIYVLRDDQSRQAILRFDYDAVLHGKKMDQNIVLTPGDTVVVPR